MKYIKKFESIVKKSLAKKNDYVLMKLLDDSYRDENLKKFLSNNIGQIIIMMKFLLNIMSRNHQIILNFGFNLERSWL